MRTIKYMTKDILRVLNKKAIDQKLNRSLVDDVFESIDDNEPNLPVVFSMVHNDVEMRVQLMFNRAGATGWLDMSFADYNALPAAEVPE